MGFRQFIEAQKVLYQQLLALRPQMAQAAQQVYNQWEQGEDDAFGVCDEIANAIGSVIAASIQDVEITDGGHDGDDHAYVVAYNATEAYNVDIPPYVYETGGGYNWKKIPGVVFTPNHVVIEEIPRSYI